VAEQRTQRKLAAILVADVVGYSRLMAEDEMGTLTALKQLRAALLEPEIADHRGRIVKLMGDGALVEFGSAVDAVDCAVTIQRGMMEQYSDTPESKRIRFRIGVNLGDVIIDNDDIYGDGVNIAARLEGISDPGGICISGTVFDQVKGKLDLSLEDLGTREVKNIAEPVRVYRWQSDMTGVAAATEPTEPTEANQMPSLPDKPSIAVLPFDNMSGDPEQDYFADGMVEDIITALSRLNQLFVISRNSSFTYKGRVVDVRQISRELGVRYVLEGSVRKAGNRLRITGQLIDGASGAHLWADRFDGLLEDVFDLQDRITENVVGAIEPTLRKAEIERSRKMRPENLDAYDLYLRALPHVYAMQPADNAQGLALLHKAIDLDSDYAPALSYAAWCYEQRLTRGWATSEESDATSCITLARRAIATNSDDANAIAASGFVLTMVGRDFDTGLAAIERAVSINPNTAAISLFAGWFYNFAGEPDAALPYFERALRLSPTDPAAFMHVTGVAMANLLSGRAEAALETAKKSIALNPEWDTNFLIMAAAARQLQQPEEAGSAVKKLLAFMPHATISLFQKHLPFRDRKILMMILDGLREGGLPE
jgi:TolB-like protein